MSKTAKIGSRQLATYVPDSQDDDRFGGLMFSKARALLDTSLEHRSPEQASAEAERGVYLLDSNSKSLGAFVAHEAISGRLTIVRSERMLIRSEQDPQVI